MCIFHRDHERGKKEETNNNGDSYKMARTFSGFCCKSMEEGREYLKRCFAGALKEEYLWIDEGFKIQEACDGKLKTNYSRGNIVLLQPLPSGEISDQELERISDWFEMLQL